MPMSILEELGQRLRTAREKKGFTQQELADLSHVSVKHIAGIEKGVKNPSFEILRALASVLEISLDTLIDTKMEQDEKGAAEMKMIYLSCPPEVRDTLLKSTRSLADHLKELAQNMEKQ